MLVQDAIPAALEIVLSWNLEDEAVPSAIIAQAMLLACDASLAIDPIGDFH